MSTSSTSQEQALRIFLVFLVLVPTWLLAADKRVSFDRQIRPILSDKCFHCHGFDPGDRKADLRLDTAEGLADVLVAGKPDKSELWNRVASDDPEEVMPPPDSHLNLSKTEKDLVRQWIVEGAAYEEHWAFAPVRKVTPPEPGHPIDAFLLRAQKLKGLQMNPPADLRVLARRAALDLTGLPPDPKVLANFLADPGAAGYRRLLDELFTSPHHGERMAWDWLDIARYADTNGYQGDRERTMWPWRDWVVDAFNRNLAFDTFTRWQIAGDQLPGAESEPVLATGFLRNYPINGEGGSIPEENRVNYVFDMTETVGMAWMGLTMECCRCHDHKFDPLSQKDYFSMTAFFNQTPVSGGGGDPRTAPNLSAPSEAQVLRQAQLTAEVVAGRKTMGELRKRLVSEQPKWEAAERKRLETKATWHVGKVLQSEADHRALVVQEGGSVLAGEATQPTDTFRVKLLLPVEAFPLRGLRLEALQDPSHTNGGKSLARSSNSGNFVLTELAVRVGGKGGENIPIRAAKATFEQGGWAVKDVFDCNPKTGWAVMRSGMVDREETAFFEFESPIHKPADGQLHVTLAFQSDHAKHIIGRFRLSGSTRGLDVTGRADDIATLIKIAPEERKKEDAENVRVAFLRTDRAYARAERRLASNEAALKKAKAEVPVVMVMKDLEKPRTTYVLNRGAYDDHGEEVGAAVPAHLAKVAAFPEANRADRLGLTEWMLSPEHPLTSRVAVNRIWQQVFGIGLVKTSEDFGQQGERPLMPDLLDYLATHYRESGWDTRAMLRLIMTSQAYQQSAVVTDEHRAKDAANRFLARSPRPRLPSWMIRDQALAVSGLLVPTLGGAPVKPYQPDGLWKEVTFGKKTYTRDTGDKLYRRTLYTFWRRIVGPPMLFDNAKRLTCEVKANRTNTPLHALTTMNDITFVEAGRAFGQAALQTVQAERLLPDGARDTVAWMFERATLRAPTKEELAILTKRLDTLRGHYGADPDAAKALLAVGELASDPDVDSAELAAHAALGNLILNLDEVLCRP